ncbi:MAG: hypothetical protein H6Q00_2652 [Holophagaceae bacterium]|nr:hypothetical protein [Holophagaceae bacterium]
MSENETPQEGLITEAIAELIALGAAAAANAENAFQVHHYRLTQLEVSKEDMIQAINIALSVKARPHQAIIDMAQTYLLGKKGGCGGADCGCGPDGCEEEAGCGSGGCGCN